MNLEISLRPYLIKLLKEKKNEKILKHYKKSSAAIIFHIILNQLLINKISFKDFKKLLNENSFTSDLSINKYTVLWVLISLFRSTRDLILKKNE